MTPLLAMLLTACASEPAPTVEDWEGAGIEPVCDAAGARVTGEVDGETVDLTVVENFGYQTYPALWAWLIDDGVRMTLVPNEAGLSAVGWSRGVFVLGDGEPLLCATHGSSISANPPRGRLRTLGRLGSCPGTEPIAGTIDGCTDPSASCRVSGGPLPAGGVAVGTSSFSQDAAQYTFQISLRDGEVLDFDSERVGGTVYYDGEVVCVADFVVDAVGETNYQFALSGLTRLGSCDESEPVGGFVNVCLPVP